MKIKICSKCKIEKSVSEFYKYKSGKNARYGYYSSFCKLCNRKKEIEKYANFTPWQKKYLRIRSRCHFGRYGERGIKNCLTIENIKYLWFRDKAYLMKQPSIDRIKGKLDYTLKNCRFMELRDNLCRKRG